LLFAAVFVVRIKTMEHNWPVQILDVKTPGKHLEIILARETVLGRLPWYSTMPVVARIW